MDKVNVLIVSGTELSPGFLDDVAAVDPRVSLKVGVKQFTDELRLKEGKGPLADRLFDEFHFWKGQPIMEEKESLDNLLAEAEVLFGRMALPDNLRERAPGLKWIHVQGAGLDAYAGTDIFDCKAIITNGRGTMSVAMAEHVLGIIFTFAKDFPRMLNSKQNKRWKRFVNKDLDQRTVGIIGLGDIGSHIARLAKGVGMRVLAIKKTVTGKIPFADEVLPPDKLHHLLSKSDFVVLSASLSAETEGLIGEEELRIMKSDAYLINISRGKMIDEPTLIKALKEGWIAGAALDVFQTEPLSPDSELWVLPNVFISPHMAGYSEKTMESNINLFCENLRRYIAGEELLNVVTRGRR